MLRTIVCHLVALWLLAGGLAYADHEESAKLHYEHGLSAYGLGHYAEAADEYAGWLSRRTGRAFRLPSEAEWEYAASGGTAREFPWGDEFTPDRANSVEFGPLTTTPVGMYPLGRSAFGIDDMARESLNKRLDRMRAQLDRPWPELVQL